MNKEIRAILDQELASGYNLRQVTFQMESGCRACPKETDSKWHVIFVSERHEERRLYIYCFATVCSGCVGTKEAHDRISERMVNLFEAVN